MGETSGGEAPAPFTGGCQCGDVRYLLTMTPWRASYCHCRMCQKAVGNAFAIYCPVKRSAHAWTRGEPRVFASSSVAERGFCARCGTPLYFAYRGSSWIALTIGSLDEPARVPPAVHLGTESQLPWLDIPDGLPREGTDPGPVQGMENHQSPDSD